MPKVTKRDQKGPLVQSAGVSIQSGGNDEAEAKLVFPPRAGGEAGAKLEFRRVAVPQNRMSPLKKHWMELYEPITKILKLDMRMNLKTKKVEIKTTPQVQDTGLLQKAADFVQGFLLGFEVRDAIALLRLDDLYIDSFEVKDVKTLQGEHLSRCIGRMVGSSGKTKFTIENATRTRIVISDTKIHILGSFQNIRIARDAICQLILGSPATKVFSKLRSVCARLQETM